MKRLKITVNGTAYDVQVEELGGSAAPVVSAPVAASAPTAPAPAAAPAQPAAATPVDGAETVDSPMPGTVLDIKVKAGEAVKEGQVILILEAMKMENEIVAPKDGTIAAIHITKGASVDSGTALVSLG